MTCFVALLVAAQTWFLANKVSWLSQEDYGKRAHDLKHTRIWRFGYVTGQHGARLVRTAPDARPLDEGDERVGVSVHDEMQRELAMAPARAALELLLYAVAAAGAWATGRLALLRRARRWRWLLLPLVAGWTLSLPLLFIGYGTSMYSNYVGPGAFSSSGPYIEVTFLPAETVSYRSAMEALGLSPLALLHLVQFGRWFPDVPFSLFWCVFVVGFYGLLGLAVGFGRERLVGRTRG
jgi:hypothetical protein